LKQPKSKHLPGVQDDSDHELENQEILDKIEKARELEKQRAKEIELKMKEKSELYDIKRENVLQKKQMLDTIHDKEAMYSKRKIDKKYFQHITL